MKGVTGGKGLKREEHPRNGSGEREREAKDEERHGEVREGERRWRCKKQGREKEKWCMTEDRVTEVLMGLV
jgi:hypothetical protein